MTTNKPIRVQIKPQIVALLEPIKPEHQTMATFINDMLFRASKGLTPYVTLNLSSEQSSPEKTKEKKQESADKFSNIESINKNKEKKKIDPFSSPKIKKELIPDDLQRHADLIVEWWPIRHKKKATCSEKVAQRIFKTLRSFTLEDQIKSLEMAIIGGYKDVYKPNLQKIYKKEEPVVNHPASKVFKASDLDWPQIKVVDELNYVDTKKVKNGKIS
tara:strand:+ start:210 stop:857 length:648 start_codon:yes stop_codon:yes gene_type:complete